MLYEVITSAVFRRSDLAGFQGSVQGLRFATFTRLTTAASARSRRLKVRTSGSSTRSPYMPEPTGTDYITPIISLYKLQVREIAKYLGVPEKVISKKSSPHLWKEHEAEKELGISYEEIDSILYCMFDVITSYSIHYTKLYEVVDY